MTYRRGCVVPPDDGRTIDDVRREAIAAGTWPDDNTAPVEDVPQGSLFDVAPGG